MGLSGKLFVVDLQQLLLQACAPQSSWEQAGLQGQQPLPGAEPVGLGQVVVVQHHQNWRLLLHFSHHLLHLRPELKMLNVP